MQHITRIAPSPTGLFHIGSARTALFNWLIAKASGGKFILRIDDTDVARHDDRAVQVIIDAMEWLQLDYDLYVHQSSRMDLYNSVIKLLLDAGKAHEVSGAIRLKIELSDKPKIWEDTVVGKVLITERDFNSTEGLVLLRSDGMPTYHFASVVDDMDLGVTWVVRGTDHLSNTPKHIVLWNILAKLDWAGKDRVLPLFAHVGLITQNGAKVSKRDGSASLLQYRDDGINSDAMFNWLLRLGWGPSIDDKTTRTISRERAIQLFLDGGKMRPSPANMDRGLLDSLDRKYKAMIIKAQKASLNESTSG
jgi:glutamyl-tRNA synthetase